MIDKECSECGELKPLNEFGMRNETRSDGTPYIYYRPNCNVCRRVREKISRNKPASRARRAAYQKEYDKRPKSRALAKARRQTQKNKEYMRKYRCARRTKEQVEKDLKKTQQRTEQQRLAMRGHRRCGNCKEVKLLEDFYYHYREDRKTHEYCARCKICESARQRILSKTEKRKEYMRGYSKKWRQTEKYKAARAKRRGTAASRFRETISQQVRQHIKKVTLGGKKKGGRLFDHLPYTIEDMKAHIESLFQPNMAWDNYGKWQIDHIVPQAKLQYDSFEHPNFTKCWSLANLQPMWASDNTRKGSFFEGVDWFYGESPEEQLLAHAETIEVYRDMRRRLIAKYVDIDTLVLHEDKEGGEISFEVKNEESLYQDIKSLRRIDTIYPAAVTHELREGIMDLVMLGYKEMMSADKEKEQKGETE